jgi:Bacterial archaeo-eukaryotic release factor family 11
MSLHIDIPTAIDLERLLEVRAAGCVSIYVPSSPITQDAEAARIELKNLASEATAQLAEAEMGKRELAELDEALGELVDDQVFWERQAHSLAVFATPQSLRTFRLPNHLTAMVEVADRFHVKPLLRAVTFPQAAFVLALSANGARLLHVTAEADPEEVGIRGLPGDAASAVGKASIGDRSADRRIQGSEGHKVRLRQYAHRVADALRPTLAGSDLPLILAATEPLDAIFRSVNSYPHLAGPGIHGSPDELSDRELADRSRAVLDRLYAEELAELTALYESRMAQGRATDELSSIARAATFGAVDTVFVDIDETIPGFLDEATGELTLDEADDAVNYGVADEIARRVLVAGGRVLAVRSDEVPGEGPVAAILRYAA